MLEPVDGITADSQLRGCGMAKLLFDTPSKYKSFAPKTKPRASL
jgi:hypothetical protein